MKDRLTPNRTVHHLSSLNNTPCAVILPILTIGGEEHILFEVRSSKLAWQPRDICFPGGRIEKSDASALDAAIRETMEELGVERSDIDILGPWGPSIISNPWQASRSGLLRPGSARRTLP